MMKIVELKYCLCVVIPLSSQGHATNLSCSCDDVGENEQTALLAL